MFDTDTLTLIHHQESVPSLNRGGENGGETSFESSTSVTDHGRCSIAYIRYAMHS